MNIDDYLVRFHVLAGSVNEAPIFADSKDYQIALVEVVNDVLKNYIPVNEAVYYRRILDYVSVSEIMIEMAKSPEKFWVAKNKVLQDFSSLNNVFRGIISSINEDGRESVKIPCIYNLGEYVVSKASSGVRMNMDIATFNYSKYRYDSFGSLITAFLENYINLVKVFYQVLDERALEFASINLSEIDAYNEKEEHYLFFEIHNFLRKMLREIGRVNISDCEICESYINGLVQNIMVMDLLTGILRDKTDITNYQKYREMEEIDSTFLFNVDSYLRKMIYKLNNTYGEGIVRS